MIKLNQEKLRHLLIGATFFSTGGGGSLSEGLKLIEGIDELTLLDVNDISSEKLCATAFLAGSVNPPSLEKLRKEYKVELRDSSELVLKAFSYLQKKINKNIDYIVPVELGGFNTAVSLFLSHKMNLPVIDADLTGRSAPEMYQTSYFVGNISPSPAAIVNLFSEKYFVEDLRDYKRFDEFLRSIVKLSYGYDVGVANYPLPVKEAEPYFIKKTLSKAIKIGALLDKGEVFRALEEANAKILFKGILIEEKFQERDGFTEGYALLEKNGEKLSLKYKNEILVSLKNDKIIASVPDLIGVVTIDGYPVINTEYPLNKQLIVFVIESPWVWKTPLGESVFNLKHFGLGHNKK